MLFDVVLHRSVKEMLFEFISVVVLSCPEDLWLLQICNDALHPWVGDIDAPFTAESSVDKYSLYFDQFYISTEIRKFSNVFF